MLNANMGQQMGCIWLDRLHMAAHVVHMAAQRLLLGALGPAYGCSEAPYGCPWGPYGRSEAALGCPWGCPWLLRGSLWASMRLHMAAQRLHLAAEGLHFAAQAVYGSHAADMQHILHLAGPGWGPGWE